MFSDELGQLSAKDIYFHHVKLGADCPASAGLIAPSGNILFPQSTEAGFYNCMT